MYRTPEDADTLDLLHTLDLLFQIIDELRYGYVWHEGVNGTTRKVVIGTAEDRVHEIRMPTEDAQHIVSLINWPKERGNL